MPNMRSSSSCAFRTFSWWSIIHRSLIAEKYVEIGRPELRGESVPDPEEGEQTTHIWRSASTPSLPFLNWPGWTSMPTVSSLWSKCATVFFVRASSQTMRRHSGLPVLRLHATALSRWFVIPAGVRREMEDARWKAADGR